MAVRLYLMPMTSTLNAERGLTQRYPKYRDTHMAGLPWGAMDYGPEDTCLVAVDIPPATHTLLAAETDVTALSANIDAQIGAQLTAVQNALEGLNFPALWVNSTHTYREVLRIVGAAFQFVQRYHGLGGGKIFGGGVTLNTTFGSLPLAVRNRLRDTADSFGFDRTGITNSTTIRVILKSMADQWADRTLDLGLVLI